MTSPENPLPPHDSGSPVDSTLQGPPREALAATHTPPPIVGVGASAGGLEALEGLLRGLPEQPGFAVVVVQHLDPTRKGMLTELLQKVTPLPVVQVEDGMTVVPNRIHVIPPGKDLSVLKGVLYLLEPAGRRGTRLPIDFFLRSLAADQGEHGVGVILSGTGCDGTLGMRALKEHAGLTLAQIPEEAQYPDMPRSVIDAGLADMVMPVHGMGERIRDYLVRKQQIGTRRTGTGDMDQRHALEKIVVLLRARTGHDFADYKTNTLYRRIERRMSLHQLDRLSNYVRFLRDNPQELDLLFKELLIGVTSFFRDPMAWESLQKQVLAPLIRSAPSRGCVLRAWVAGCSTGEEAYSLAIAFREVLEESAPVGRVTLQIFATDLSEHAIDRARQGLYPASIVADVSPVRLQHFFQEEAGGYRVNRAVRETVVFATQNLIMDPPFTKLNLVICRNLLIYLNTTLQHKLLPLFHYSLLPGGVLFLGNAESVGGGNELFTALDARAHLFRRAEARVRVADLDFHARPPEPEVETLAQWAGGAPTGSLQSLAEQVLLREFAPPALLVNADGDILYIFGRTGDYLEPATGRANWNIHVMARDGLRQELALLLPRAMREKKVFSQPGIGVGSAERMQLIDLTVYPIEEPQVLSGMLMIVFQVVSPQPAPLPEPRDPKERKNTRIQEMELALQQTREELRMTREYMQTSQEELRSANEELQSTNEELTTSKEEMQSLNEELQTVNVELQSKVEELTLANGDMKNLLDSTDIATVFLTKDLRIRRFTAPARRIFKLIATDVGRPLSDIVTELEYPDLQHDALEVLQSLSHSIEEIPTRDERWYQVKIMPYRTLDDVIDGVVVTFTDITKAKALENRLRSLQSTPEESGRESGNERARRG
ncbi:chemotaxis protein CheB [Ectothiorhodospira lacustris]|uniref:chemotaxis protein CheB n=1 Tax=Ectothiorhodospira lacustris TaxID=2899127 RepID=UPI001EE81817|nr:PAS domain-containing protein [Ectothiorhodospira lacustris]MCG5520626.1 PAS domain-containing protein [Ectothiorhodospira lacustris]